MTELERALAALDVDWPETPVFDVRAPAPRRRWRLAAAIAVVLAVAAAFAVPQSRGAILRFFHLGAVSIERVQTLPPARRRSLPASLGVRISGAEAATLLGRPFAVPGERLYRAGRVVSTLLSGNVLLSEVRTGSDPVLLKKFAAGATEAEGVAVAAGVPAIWIHGGRHVFLAPQLSPRYAGNTLVWQRGAITFRLEGKGLTEAGALRLARTLR